MFTTLLQAASKGLQLVQRRNTILLSRKNRKDKATLYPFLCNMAYIAFVLFKFLVEDSYRISNTCRNGGVGRAAEIVGL